MIIEKVKSYIANNNISKKELADKMNVSERKLERILNTPDGILSCLTYKKLVCALGVSADTFTE